MIKCNVGEWSEVYVLLKLLADGKLKFADENLEFIERLCIPIVKIIREERENPKDYVLQEGNVKIVSPSNPDEELSIPITTFAEHARVLLNKMKQTKETTFEIAELTDFLNQICVTKAKPTGGKKSDIKIVVQDVNIGENSLEYSIKSLLRSPPTLLNASKATNCIYRVESCNANAPPLDIEKINAIDKDASGSKIQNRIRAIELSQHKLKFVKMASNTFQRNLKLIDSALPQILAYIVKLKFTENSVDKLPDLIQRINQDDPIGFGISESSHPFYEYKIKNFLTDVALGMTPTKVWNGIYDATGGFLIVKKDGEIACYHIYHRALFQKYLVHNTFIEQSSMDRHEYGSIYAEGDSLFMNLNLSIRYNHKNS